MKRWMLYLAILSFALVVGACANNETGKNNPDKDPVEDSNVKEESSDSDIDPKMVHVDMMEANGEKIGTATLEEGADGVKVHIGASNLSEGEHGFHFHENGVCEGPDFESAGGHFNPTGANHGADDPDGPHAGDLPNIEVGEGGMVDQEFVAKDVTLKSGEKNSLFKDGGTSLIIHADPDDGKSQPAGDAGDRIACGVIGE